MGKNSSPYFLPFTVAVTAILFLTLRVWLVFSNSTDLAGIEQNVVYSVQILLDSGKLYLSPSEPPFSITQYTPLYYYVCALVAKITGTVSEDIEKIYYIGRFLNILFNLLASIIIFKISKKVLDLSRSNSLILALMSFIFLFPHNFAARPDSLHDVLGIMSIYLFLISIKGNKFKGTQGSIYFILLGLLTALAVFSKQSGIQFIIIFAGYFMINRDFRALIKLAFFSAFIYASVLLMFRLLYPSFFENVIGGVANGINIENFVNYVITKKLFILTVWPIIAFALYYIVKQNSIFKGKDEYRALALSLLGTFIFATATALKMGSTVQYFVVFANICLLALVKFSLFRRRFLYAYFFVVAAGFAAQNLKLIITFDHNVALDSQRNSAREVAEFIEGHRVRNNGRYIFSNLTTDYSIPSRQFINNIFYRDCLLPQMDILEYSTGPSKVVDYKKFKGMLESGEVEYLIDSQPKSKFSILGDIEEIKNTHFRLVKEINGYLIYQSQLN